MLALELIAKVMNPNHIYNLNICDYKSTTTLRKRDAYTNWRFSQMFSGYYICKITIVIACFYNGYYNCKILV